MRIMPKTHRNTTISLFVLKTFNLMEGRVTGGVADYPGGFARVAAKLARGQPGCGVSQSRNYFDIRTSLVTMIDPMLFVVVPCTKTP